MRPERDRSRIGIRCDHLAIEMPGGVAEQGMPAAAQARQHRALTIMASSLYRVILPGLTFHYNHVFLTTVTGYEANHAVLWTYHPFC